MKQRLVEEKVILRRNELFVFEFFHIFSDSPETTIGRKIFAWPLRVARDSILGTRVSREEGRKHPNLYWIFSCNLAFPIRNAARFKDTCRIRAAAKGIIQS